MNRSMSMNMSGEDPTEAVRRQIRLNLETRTREDLEKQYGQVWDTGQLTEEFRVAGFLSPFVMVVRKSDNKRGTLMFKHDPRFYFSFEVAEQ